MREVNFFDADLQALTSRSGDFGLCTDLPARQGELSVANWRRVFETTRPTQGRQGARLLLVVRERAPERDASNPAPGVELGRTQYHATGALAALHRGDPPGRRTPAVPAFYRPGRGRPPRRRGCVRSDPLLVVGAPPPPVWCLLVRQPAVARIGVRYLLCRSLTGSTRPGGLVQSDRTVSRQPVV